LHRELTVGQSASDEISHRVVGLGHLASVLGEARKAFTHNRFGELGHASEVRVDRHRGRADLACQCSRLNRRRSVSFEHDQSGGHQAVRIFARKGMRSLVRRPGSSAIVDLPSLSRVVLADVISQPPDCWSASI
jgi:hypothetical protein